VEEAKTGDFEAAMDKTGHQLNAIGWLEAQTEQPLISVI
jgi:hypothetical protein